MLNWLFELARIQQFPKLAVAGSLVVLGAIEVLPQHEAGGVFQASCFFFKSRSS